MELLVSYLAKLKQIALDCDFGSNLSSSLRDQLVWGISNEKMKRRLLAEPTLSMDKAVEICAAMEAAERDVADMGSATQSNSKGIALNYDTKKTRTQPKGFKGRTTCFCCGKPNHRQADCRFKNFNCNICGKRGHLAAVCRNRNKKVEFNTKKTSFTNFTNKSNRESQKFLADNDLTELFNM